MLAHLFRLISSLKADQKEGSEAGKQTVIETHQKSMQCEASCGSKAMGQEQYLTSQRCQVGMSVSAAPVSAYPQLALIAYG